ncbi:PA14 domain protein [Pirellula staleyi DSM 6068]|uniref:PA14 domain protein n=1 Tax=Pirellula staleyi (strain ATCC 27377 / DSM 6068 / ICPB 4128) TaxID=530564 RepID=D2R153_PIRSD|nr:PA14 domain-containing protein [Pirellula staleyi]ADB18538.1 PA14 domain protein [Pirellula staleyi DSM 6068]
MRRGFSFLFLSMMLAWAPLVVAQEAPPRVIGYERFHASGDQALRGGQLLLGELNCTSCHAADAALASAVQKKPAPILDSVGNRVKMQYLMKFLADPQTVKPGTTMPGVLHTLPDAERAAAAEAIVHFLATTGTTQETSPLRQAAMRGEKIYHEVGCLACHDSRKEGAVALPTSIPLGTPSRKYTLAGLTEFLSDPLKVRPGGRMPHLLNGTDARDVASYLLNDLPLASGLQFAYYEGTWDKLPDFSKLTPKSTGDASVIDVSVVKAKENFALRFDGLLQIPADGNYLFLIGSDDGSRLSIDGKVLIDNDGVHPFSQKRKPLKLKAGLIPFVVEYFEAAGEEQLQVLVEREGHPQQSLSDFVAIPAPKPAAGSETPAEFVVKPELAAKGRELFASVGCANCHQLKIGGEAVAAKATAPALSALKGEGGCLESSRGKTPYYALGAVQRTSLVEAIKAAKQPAAEQPKEELISAQMARFNCYACHARGEIGGIEQARNPHFLSDMPEMGDEGRIPPALTGVGAKLQPEWLKTVFAEGAKDRPYMFTRMPRFGLENVGTLIDQLAEVDLAKAKAAPKVDVDLADKKLKAAGRRLVGSQGYSCVKCHTFADKKATGIQALSMTTMTKRLRPEWFHNYLLNPQEFRPGTRMPAAWPGGVSQLPSILEGNSDKQIMSIYAYLTDGDQATLPIGLVTGKMELIAFDEAVMYRNFIEGAGSRAIGVGYAEKLNLAFDANNVRMAMFWQGSFIDAARHWTGRGVGYEPPLGDNVLKFPEGIAFAKLAAADTAWPGESAEQAGYRFLGYRLGELRKPTFRYAMGDVVISDYVNPVADSDAVYFSRQFTLEAPGAVEGLYYRAIVASKIEAKEGGTYLIDDKWTTKITSAGKPVIRSSGGKSELLVPVVIENGKAQITQTYDW